MNFIEWGEKYSVDIAEVDKHHEHLVGIINRLYSSIFECESLEREQALTGEILDELMAYTQYHFSTEEDFMGKFVYHELADHRAEHVFFINKMQELMEQHQQGVGALSFSIFEFLRDWLVRHISGSDKKMGMFLKEQGCK